MLPPGPACGVGLPDVSADATVGYDHYGHDYCGDDSCDDRKRRTRACVVRYHTSQPSWEAVGLTRLVTRDGSRLTRSSAAPDRAARAGRCRHGATRNRAAAGSSCSCRRAGARMAGRVVSGVRVLNDASDDLVDAVAELAGEQDRDQRWRVRADELAALAVAGPAVVADVAVVEVVDDPLPEHGGEDIPRLGRPRTSACGGVRLGGVVEDAGQVGAVSASFLHEDQRAEPIGDQALDDGGLVAGGLVRDAQPPGDLPSSQFLDEPQLVDLLLAIGEGGDTVSPACRVRPARRAARRSSSSSSVSSGSDLRAGRPTAHRGLPLRMYPGRDGGRSRSATRPACPAVQGLCPGSAG